MLLTLAFAAEPLATVDGVPITDSDVAAALEGVDPAARAGVDRAAVVDELVVRQLLAAEVDKRKIADTPEGKAAAVRATREALSTLLLQRVLAERVDDEAVRRFYEENAGRYARPEVHARHILVATQEEARGLLTALKGGADFATVAAERSLDPGSAPTGGDLGWFPRQAMVAPFADAAFGGRAGETVGPVQTQFGWHLIQIVETRDRVPLADAAPEIRSQLQPQVLNDYIAELRAKAQITVATPRSLVSPVAKGPSLPAAAKGGPAVRIVAFIDMQCPHCHEMHLALDRLVASRPDVAVTYRHYPLENTCNPAVERTGRVLACESARAVICAEGNAKLTAELLGNGDVLDRAGVAAAGPKHGISAKKWSACLTGADAAARLAGDVAEGAALGIEGTPTVYLQAAGGWYRLDGGTDDLAGAVAQVQAGS